MRTRRLSSPRREDQVSRTIDHVLTQIFGKDAAHLIYEHLERNYSLRRDEISERIDEFAKGLEEFLSSGAQVVERKIVADIYSSRGLLCSPEFDGTQPDSDFVHQIRSLTQKA